MLRSFRVAAQPYSHIERFSCSLSRLRGVPRDIKVSPRLTLTACRIVTAQSFSMSSTQNHTNGSAAVPLSQLSKTDLVFHSAAHQQTYTHETTIASIHALEELPESDSSLFKPSPSDPPSASVYALTTTSTIFHPQGGGQPSDVGHFKIGEETFRVVAARTSPTNPQIVLHFGFFSDPATSASTVSDGTKITQHVDADKRLLFSRLHTAGHVLGSATRKLLEDKVENFDELKASHFPDSASCEFAGLIDGKYKADIQGAVDELVASDAEVRIGWWRKTDFKTRGLERLLPEDKVWQEIAVLVDDAGHESQLKDGESRDDETRIRVVEIVGTEVYPCGGTHVPTTRACGKVGVKKISRSKGTSRVSYLVN